MFEEEELAAIVAAAPTTIVVARREKLLSIDCVHALALALVTKGKALYAAKGKRLSRQGTTEWLMDIIHAYDERGGEIHDENGRIDITDDMEDLIFGEDLSRAWTTNVKRFARRKPLRNPKEHLLLRLQMFQAAFLIIGEPLDIPEV